MIPCGLPQGHSFADRIETYTDYLIGLPGDTYESFTTGVKKVIEMGQHNRIRFGTVAILPNAKIGDPEYQKKHGIVSKEVKLKMQHSILDSSNEDILETQVNVIATKTMPKMDWIKTKVFTWWCSFLYFDKILQIPMILLHDKYDADYKEMFEVFILEEDIYPIISEIQKFFKEGAIDIQNGGNENRGSKEWLNLNWPSDEYIFIKLVFENKLEAFYLEAKKLLCYYLKNKDLEIPPFLNDAFVLNHSLIKTPFNQKDILVQTTYNIWESYLKAVSAEEYSLENGKYDYLVDCTSEVWKTWDDWFRKVVWYGSRQGAYIYKVKSTRQKKYGRNGSIL